MWIFLSPDGTTELPYKKMGRPKKSNPRNRRLDIKVSAEELRQLDF